MSSKKRVTWAEPTVFIDKESRGHKRRKNTANSIVSAPARLLTAVQAIAPPRRHRHAMAPPSHFRFSDLPDALRSCVFKFLLPKGSWLKRRHKVLDNSEFIRRKNTTIRFDPDSTLWWIVNLHPTQYSLEELEKGPGLVSLRLYKMCIQVTSYWMTAKSVRVIEDDDGGKVTTESKFESNITHVFRNNEEHYLYNPII